MTWEGLTVLESDSQDSKCGKSGENTALRKRNCKFTAVVLAADHIATGVEMRMAGRAMACTEPLSELFAYVTVLYGPRKRDECVASLRVFPVFCTHRMKYEISLH
jgi:hypothetical protein